MNYNRYPNKRNDTIDPNYIYPQPYIDPLMYMNASMMNGNLNINPQYPTYQNPYVDNIYNNQYENPQEYINDNLTPNENIPLTENNISGIPIIPPNIQPNIPQSMPYNIYPMGVFPPNMMYPNIMPPNMMPPIYPNIMYPGMFPSDMISNMPAFNMEEFDEEEM